MDYLFLWELRKSAQFPLHVWDADAMEGPTPVSALIHAATMVVAGVYLSLRIFPFLTAEALHVVALIGAITAILASLIATSQYDIKKILAYSTVSQLGYMICSIGVGAYFGHSFILLLMQCLRLVSSCAVVQLFMRCIIPKMRFMITQKIHKLLEIWVA